MSLFVPGLYRGASGPMLNGKIECDALTKEDWAWAASIVFSSGTRFRTVDGVPTGGLPFAEALYKYAEPLSDIRLIVDDVWTTGETMRGLVGPMDIGFVLFARSPLPSWCQCIFQGHPALGPM